MPAQWFGTLQGRPRSPYLDPLMQFLAAQYLSKMENQQAVDRQAALFGQQKELAGMEQGFQKETAQTSRMAKLAEEGMNRFLAFPPEKQNEFLSSEQGTMFMKFFSDTHPGLMAPRQLPPEQIRREELPAPGVGFGLAPQPEQTAGALLGEIPGRTVMAPTLPAQAPSEQERAELEKTRAYTDYLRAGISKRETPAEPDIVVHQEGTNWTARDRKTGAELWSAPGPIKPIFVDIGGQKVSFILGPDNTYYRAGAPVDKTPSPGEQGTQRARDLAAVDKLHKALLASLDAQVESPFLGKVPVNFSGLPEPIGLDREKYKNVNDYYRDMGAWKAKSEKNKTIIRQRANNIYARAFSRKLTPEDAMREYAELEAWAGQLRSGTGGAQAPAAAAQPADEAAHIQRLSYDELQREILTLDPAEAERRVRIWLAAQREQP